MSQNAVEQIRRALHAGLSDLNERSGETITQVASSVNRVLEEAGSEGAKIRRALVRNWTTLERPRRRRSVPLLLGIFGVGVAAAYLARRVAATARA